MQPENHQSVCVYMYKCIYVCICTMSSPMSLYIYFMSGNKYDCHITNINHSAIMIIGHFDPTFLHMCAKIQPTAISTSPLIAMYRSAINMPLNLLHVEI